MSAQGCGWEQDSQEIDTKDLLGCWKCSKTGLYDVCSGNI